MYRNNVHTRFLLCMIFIVTFIASPLFAMEPEELRDVFSKIPKELFFRICTTRVCKYPWQELVCIARLKEACKAWNDAVPALKDFAEIFHIPPMHFAAAMGNTDEIVRLKLKEKRSVQEPDENMLAPSDYTIFRNL
jgi:hypothetical protein